MSNFTQDRTTLALKDRKEFIDALNSGDYKQCFDSYINHEENKACEFCAIGVAMHLLNDNPKTVLQKLDSIKEKYLIDRQHVNDIVYLNDDAKFSFDTIAKSLVERGFLERVEFRHYPRYPC